MRGGTPDNPWDRLRTRAQPWDEAEPQDRFSWDEADPVRPLGRPGRERMGFLPPGGAERLWSATSEVLGALRRLIEVAESITIELARSGEPDPSSGHRQPARPGPAADRPGFERVGRLDDDEDPDRAGPL